MDCYKIGKLIAKLRKEKNLTQNELAIQLNVTNKAISKWETGVGCPDISYWADLPTILEFDILQMIGGELTNNKINSGNMKNIKIHCCETCNNILVSTGESTIFCCGKKLNFLNPVNKEQNVSYTKEAIDYDLYLTFNHEMNKDNYLSFIVYTINEQVTIIKLYPEQNPEVRIPKSKRLNLYVYSTNIGLMNYGKVF